MPTCHVGDVRTTRTAATRSPHVGCGLGPPVTEGVLQYTWRLTIHCRVERAGTPLPCCLSSDPGAPQLQVGLVGALSPRVEPWASLGYLHFPGSEELAKGCTHWLVADYCSKARHCRSRSQGLLA